MVSGFQATHEHPQSPDTCRSPVPPLTPGLRSVTSFPPAGLPGQPILSAHPLRRPRAIDGALWLKAGVGRMFSSSGGSSSLINPPAKSVWLDLVWGWGRRFGVCSFDLVELRLLAGGPAAWKESGGRRAELDPLGRCWLPSPLPSQRGTAAALGNPGGLWGL